MIKRLGNTALLYPELFAVFLMTGCGLGPRDFVSPEILPAIQFPTSEEIAEEAVVPSSYIVTFRGQADSSYRLTRASYLQEFQFHYQYLSEAHLADPRVRDLRFIHAVDMREQGPDLADDLPTVPGLLWALAGDEPAVGAITEVTFQSDEDARSALAEWHEQGLVWFAEPNYLSYLSQPQTNGLFSQLATEYSGASIWWHQAIKLYDALNLMASRDTSTNQTDDEVLANPPVIAVLDSGLDVSHSAFQDRVFINSSPGAAGCVGDVNGCDTTAPRKGELGHGNVSPFAYDGAACPEEKSDRKNCQHGTHVSGIIAGRLEGGIGGACPVCKVMTIKIISGSPGKGAAKDSAIINGLVYLSRFAKKGDQSALVRVANSSFGKYSRSRAVSLMVNVLSKAPQELLVVGAASNEDSMLRAYPAALNQAIAVAALDSRDRKASYSNFGSWISVSAPGGDDPNLGRGPGILSSVPGGLTEEKQGTSMAAPVVAGVAGLILSVDPKRSFSKLRSSLIDTADSRIYNNAGDTAFNQNYYVNIGLPVKQPLLGSGVIDAAAAITGTAKTGITVSSLRRVDRGCSVIGDEYDGVWLSIVLLLLPILLAGFSNRATRTAGYAYIPLKKDHL